MQAKELAFQVSVINQNLFGMEAKITMRPSEQKGWHWEYASDKKTIPISAELLSFKKRRLVLKYGNSFLNIYEHIGALRWTGLDSIIISSAAWPPYDGRSWELYQTLRPCIIGIDRKIQWCTLDREVSAEYNGSRSGNFTRIVPNHSKSLEIIVICEYKDLGKKTVTIKFPSENKAIEQIFKAFAPGWPPSFYYFQKFISLLGWPHLEKSIWPNLNHNNKEQLLGEFALHRATDLLGALSLIHPERLLSGIVVSYCSGHWADAEVVKKSQPYIKLID